MKKCYYEILGVDRKAPVEDIKTSYKKLALKYHPDKNRAEDAKEIFQQIQEAYQTLSDINERTWYDNNRERILLGKDNLSKEDLEEQAFGFNIWPFFSTSCYKGFDDDDEGFYKVYREVFEKIKQEESKAYEFSIDNDDVGEFVKYSGFGDSSSNIDHVMGFYKQWQAFTSYKSFAWADEWDTREGPNRDIRRQMEKENKQHRKQEKKSYIETVKKLIGFCKMRDPRYKAFSMQQQSEEIEKEIKKKMELKQKKEQEQVQKQELKQQMIIEEEKRWKEAEEVKRQKEGDDFVEESKVEIISVIIYSELYIQEYYCEICDKQFRTENQLLNHNTSKQHKKMLKELIQEVAHEDEKELLQEQFSITLEDKQQSKSGLSKKQKKNKNKKAKEQEIELIFSQDKHKNEVQEESEEEKPSKFIQEDEQEENIDISSKKQKKKKKKNKRDELIADDIIEENLKEQIQKITKISDEDKTILTKEPELDQKDSWEQIPYNNNMKYKKNKKKQQQEQQQKPQQIKKIQRNSDSEDSNKQLGKKSESSQESDDEIDQLQFLGSLIKNSKSKFDAQDSDEEVSNKKSRVSQKKYRKNKQQEELEPEVKDVFQEDIKVKKQKPQSQKQKEEKVQKVEIEKVVKDEKVEESKQDEGFLNVPGSIINKKNKKKLKSTVADSMTCNVCKEQFQSKTKLFNHVRELGHAQAI